MYPREPSRFSGGALPKRGQDRSVVTIRIGAGSVIQDQLVAARRISPIHRDPAAHAHARRQRRVVDVDLVAARLGIDDQIRENTEALFLGGDRDGTLEERILHAVERRADGYEVETNMILCTAAQLWRYEVLRTNYARYQRGLRKDLDDWLPELKKLSREQREAVDAIASFEMWHRLRYHQGLGKHTAIDVIVGLLNPLIDD